MEHKKAIHTPTEEEFKLVIKQLSLALKDYWDIYKENTCVYETGHYSSLEWSKKEGYSIITFDEFCKERGIENPFEKKEAQFEIGKWYKCSCNSNLYQFDGFLENKKFGSSAVINPKGKVNDAKPGYTKRVCYAAWVQYFSPSSLADMDLVNRFLPKEKEEWFPQVGDWCYVIQSASRPDLYNGSVSKVVRINYGMGELENGFSFTSTNPQLSKYLRKALSHEIPSSSNSISYSLPIEGEMNTHGLKVGDLLPERILNAWISQEKNYFGGDNIWYKSSNCIGDREIKEFTIKNGVEAFLISGTSNVWSRCEGFLEFMNNFEKPKESFILPEKWCIKSGEKEVVDYCNKNGKYKGYTQEECGNSYCHFPISNGCTTRTDIALGYTEITFDQFKENVLKENVAEKEKKKSWSQLIEEAAEIYPIGSMFYDLVHKAPFVVASHDFDSFGNQNQIYVPVTSRPNFTNKTARLYKDGIWAQKCANFGSTVYSGDSKYITGIDPYQADDRVMGMVMAVQAQSINELKSIMNRHLGVSADRIGKSNSEYPLTPDQCYKYPLLSIKEEELTFDPSLVKPIKSITLLLSIED